MTDQGEIYQERTAQGDTYPFSAAHYRLAMEAAGIGLWDWELTQDRQIWTSQCKAIFGLAPEEEVGYMRFLSLLHVDDQERVDRLVEESLIKRTEYSTEYRVIWPDGSLHWVGARGRGIYDEAGMPIRLIGVAFDVTPRKAVEEVQRQADERMRTILDSVEDAFIHLDQEWRFTYVNSRAANIGGYIPEAELLGRKIWEVYPPLIGTDTERYFHQVMETRQPVAYEIYYAGIQSWYEIRAYPAEDGGITAFLTDVSARKKLESERYETERKKDEFISMASHELRTPLTSIKGNLQLVQRQLQHLLEGNDNELVAGEKTVAEHLAQWTERALRQVNVESRLINDLLDASRIQTNQLRVALEPGNLAQIVSDAVADVQAVADTRTINLEMPEQAEIPVMVDRVRIGQVVTNYLSNALKYSPADQPVAVGLTLAGNEARVWVKDAGPGISQEALHYIWDRFRQVGSFVDYTRLGGGLGLGLYINQALVQLHGGRSGVESQRGKGSTFWFTLPLAAPVPLQV